jgi:hypothetical protein
MMKIYFMFLSSFRQSSAKVNVRLRRLLKGIFLLVVLSHGGWWVEVFLPVTLVVLILLVSLVMVLQLV